MGYYRDEDAISVAALLDEDEPMMVEELSETLISGFIIYGYTNTEAETYANRNNITFVSLGTSYTDISDYKVSLSNSEYTYTGYENTPQVLVYDGNGYLTEGTDYTVSYTNNVNVGTAKVTITGIGNYTGTLTATFAIKASASSSPSVSLSTGEISSLTNTSSGIKIKWTAVDGADGYYIYRKTSSGSYSRIKTIKSASTVSYTDKKVVDKTATTNTYKVVPYSGSTKGAGTAKTTVRLTGTTLTAVKNSAAGKAKVKWTVVTSVTGYQIQYSTSKTFASGNKTKKASGATSVSKTLSSLTKGKTYYVRIRTYKTVNGTTYYSAWSSKLKVKITK
ncbi:MAG: hypothetical protein LUF30_02145 [Lachnospiraceae bacterium]|nr:hypothetical protein [Lachnospiraceae bacterium]